MTYSSLLPLFIDPNLGLVLVGVFLLLVFFRVPLFLALYVPPLFYLLYFDISVFVAVQRSIRILNNFTLLAVPLFIFLGTLMSHSGIADRILQFASDVLGDTRGGLAQVNILASLVFSGMSGSALADVGSIGKIIIPTMKEHGYSSHYSAALTSASATTGPIFPPSVPIIIFGIIAGVSVLDLFIAGIVPALLIVVLLMIVTFLLGYRHDFPVGDSVELSIKLRSFVSALPFLSVPVVLVGGMLLGFYGPTEVAVATVVYLIFILLFLPDRLRIPNYLWSASVETVRINAIIMVIVPGAALFSWVLSLERTAGAFAAILFSITTEVILLLLLINIFLLILGLFLDAVSALLVSIPLVFPVAVDLGLDPVHTGIIMVFNLMIGLLTPPVGLSLYLSSEIAEAPVDKVIKSTVPYYIALLVCLLLITYIPSLSLWLPGVVR